MLMLLLVLDREDYACVLRTQCVWGSINVKVEIRRKRGGKIFPSFLAFYIKGFELGRLLITFAYHIMGHLFFSISLSSIPTF